MTPEPDTSNRRVSDRCHVDFVASDQIVQIADVISAKNGSFDTGFRSIGGHGAPYDCND